MPRHEPVLTDLQHLESRWESLRELGGSANVTLILARQRTSGRLVVVEVAQPRSAADADELARMQRAASSLIGVEDRHLAAIEDVVALPSGAIAIEREYIEGRSLGEVVRERGELPVDVCDRVLREIAYGLATLHARGLVHRDVRPEHVFLDIDGGRVVLGGLASARKRGDETRLGAWESAQRPPFYLSPEQVEGRVLDARSDIYSLGLVAWTMLTGRRPWGGESVYAVAEKQVHEELPAVTTIRDDVPAGLETVLARALRKMPDERWPSVRGLLDALGDGVTARAARAGVAAGVAPLAAPHPVPTPVREPAPESFTVPVASRPARQARRSPAGGIVAVLALLLIAAGAFYVVLGGRSATTPPTASSGDVATGAVGDSIALRTLPRTGRDIPAQPPDPSALGTTTMPSAAPYPSTVPPSVYPPGPAARLRRAADSAAIDSEMVEQRARRDSVTRAAIDSAVAERRRLAAERDSLERVRRDSVHAKRDSVPVRRDSVPPDTTRSSKADTSGTVR